MLRVPLSLHACPKTQLPLWEHTVFCSKYSTDACIYNPADKSLIWIQSLSSARHLPAMSERQHLNVFCLLWDSSGGDI